MGFKPFPYQNLCVHHILQMMLQKVLHIHSRTSLCCLDSFWYQSFSCWERWQLHRITIKLPLQIDPFCPCLCCFLASHRGHYPTLSVFGSYIRSFSHFPCHFMIESWGWSLSTLSWSDFLKSRVFQPDWLYTAQEDVSDHRKIAKILLSSLLDVVRRNFRVTLQYLVNACMLVEVVIEATLGSDQSERSRICLDQSESRISPMWLIDVTIAHIWAWFYTWPHGIKNTRTQELNPHCLHSFIENRAW